MNAIKYAKTYNIKNVCIKYMKWIKFWLFRMPKIWGKSSPTISPAVVINNDLTFQLQLISKEFNNCVKKIPEQDKNR